MKIRHKQTLFIDTDKSAMQIQYIHFYTYIQYIQTPTTEHNHSQWCGKEKGRDRFQGRDSSYRDSTHNRSDNTCCQHYSTILFLSTVFRAVFRKHVGLLFRPFDLHKLGPGGHLRGVFPEHKWHNFRSERQWRR